MESISLKNVFIQSEESLKSSLRGMYLPRDYKEVQQVINEHITKLLTDNNEFKANLNASDAEYLNSILRMSLSFQKLTFSDSINFAELSTVYEYDIKESNKGNADVLENTITLLPTVITAFFNPWLALVVGGATVLYKKVNPSEKGKPQITKRKVDRSKPITEDMLSDISDAIRNICKEIDTVIEKIKRDRSDLIAKYKDEVENKTLEKMYPQVLTGMQYLYMENAKNEQKNQNIESMLFQLGVYGYKVLEYSAENDNHFSHQVKYGIEKPEMYLPAIVKENEDGTLMTAIEGIYYVPQN